MDISSNNIRRICKYKLNFPKCSVVSTVRCYDDYFLILSTFSILFEYRLHNYSLDIKLTFCQISCKSNNRKVNFESSPGTFGTDLVHFILMHFAHILCLLSHVVHVWCMVCPLNWDNFSMLHLEHGFN